MVEHREDGTWRPVVMDFGLAHDTDASHELTQSGALLGTPQYMSPEQARGIHCIDHRTDVYSLGAMLYELLTTQPPFRGKGITDTLLQIVEVDPTPPRRRVGSVPADLETIALKCLQKEPSRRYETARALAEDLRRYVAGVSIRGRRDGHGHRVRTWARKRRAVIASLMVALVSAVACTGVLLRVRQKTRDQAEQARLAEQLNQEVRDMEQVMRIGYMMPLHDISAEKLTVRRQLSELELRLARLVPQRRAPTEYALGRGYLALHDYVAALPRLQAAWEKGLRSPEVSYALGQAYGGVYRVKLAEAQRSGDAEYTQRTRQRLDVELLTSARQQLHLVSATQQDAPELVAGLLAYYSQRHSEAVQQADAAVRRHPWLYEAHVLAGDAQVAQGSGYLESGRCQEAQILFERALEQYQAALELARSDSSVYNSAAGAWAAVIDSSTRQGGEPSRFYRNGLQAADSAIRADPGSLEGFESKLHVMQRWGRHLYAQGANLQEHAALAARVLEQESRLGNPSAIAQASVGILYKDAVEYSIAHELDPRPWLERTRALLAKATATSPELTWALGSWAATELTAIDWLSRRGGSLDELVWHLPELEKTAQRAMQLGPRQGDIADMLINLYARHSRIAQSSGKPSAAYVERALSLSKQLGADKDLAFPILNQLALVHLVDAQNRYDESRDLRPALAGVYEYTTKALLLKADAPQPYQSRAEAQLIAASEALRRGGNAAPEIARGMQALAERARYSPNDARDETLRARLLVVAARWLTQQSMSAGRIWHKAGTAAARAVKLDEMDPDAHLARAEVARYRLELRAARGSTAKRLLDEGLVAAEQTLRQQPWNDSARAAQASLWQLRSQHGHHSSRRQTSPDRGHDALASVLPSSSS